VTIQDLGSLGELIAALATIATLVYLAAQVRQNTRALRSSTFQGVSEQMAQNVGPLIADAGIAPLLIKGQPGLDHLTPEERLRFQSFFQMTFRRMEAVHVLATLGSLEPGHVRGFELSILSTLHAPGPREWWKSAKATFNRSFADHVDAWLAANAAPESHPSLGTPLSGGALRRGSP